MGPGSIDITAAEGATLALMPERAALWREGRALLVSDLHLGKVDILASWSGMMSAAAAEGVLRADLDRLSGAARAAGVGRVVVVGDLLHAPAALSGPMVDTVAAWRREQPWEMVLVAGNHDRLVERVATAWGLTLAGEELREGAMCFVHEPTEREGLFCVCGHEHPAAVLRGAGTRLKLPAFHLRAGRLTLPAFSRFTAGGEVEIRPGDRLFAVTEGAVVEVPARAGRGGGVGHVGRGTLGR